MADPFSAANSMTMAPLEYWNRSEKNKAAHAQNATSNKWAPLLALNNSKGKGDLPVQSASFVDVFGPAMTSAMNSMNPMQGMGGGGGDKGGGGGRAAASLDQGELMEEPMGAASGAGAGAMMGFMAGGGEVPKYGGGGEAGGGMADMIKPLMSLAPLLLMLPGGGMVPGNEQVPGDSPQNDTSLIRTSPGEVVVPKSVVNSPNKWEASNFVNKAKKHGPGPLPIKPGAGAKPMHNRNPKSSMSPWTAMCGGGGTR